MKREAFDRAVAAWYATASLRERSRALRFAADQLDQLAERDGLVALDRNALRFAARRLRDEAADVDAGVA